MGKENYLEEQQPKKILFTEQITFLKDRQIYKTITKKNNNKDVIKTNFCLHISWGNMNECFRRN